MAEQTGSGKPNKVTELGILLKKYFTEEDLTEIIHMPLFNDKEVKTINDVIETKRKD